MVNGHNNWVGFLVPLPFFILRFWERECIFVGFLMFFLPGIDLKPYLAFGALLSSATEWFVVSLLVGFFAQIGGTLARYHLMRTHKLVVYS
jgi:hypothetical protein